MTPIKKYILIVLALIINISCKKLIHPPAISAPNSYLVVNGSIVSGDSTIISLSRTVNVASGGIKPRPELNALVTIEGSQGGSFPLISKNNGNYISAPLNLSATENYRLKITTSDRKQYASDFVPLKNSPPIDSVNYIIGADGLYINVNTHDATNNSRYYRWDYEETYIIHSKYQSFFKVVNGDTTASRTPDEQIYQCWVTDTASTIITGTSAKLSKDVISQQPIIFIPSTSDKVSIRYSILVKQYATTGDAFNYYNLLKKNTEQIGGIFDPQPSGLTGNIQCLSNPSEPVLGYVTAGSIAQTRIYIDPKDLPAWTAPYPYPNCSLDTALYVYVDTRFPPPNPPTYYQVHDLIYDGVETPIDVFNRGNPKWDVYAKGGFTCALPICVDCTLRGRNKPPAFWK